MNLMMHMKMTMMTLNYAEHTSHTFWILNKFAINISAKWRVQFQGIALFCLHTPRWSANGMNHTCLCLPSWSWYSFINPGETEGWVGLGWLVGYMPKSVSDTGNWVAHLSANRARRRLTSLIETNALTTTPGHWWSFIWIFIRQYLTATTVHTNTTR